MELAFILLTIAILIGQCLVELCISLVLTKGLLEFLWRELVLFKLVYVKILR